MPTTKELAQSFLDFRNEKNKEKQEEIPVSKSKEKSPCESCGEVKPLASHLGKLVCSPCLGVRASINVRPQSVVDSLREIKGSLVQFLTEDEGNSAVQIYTKFAPKEENSGQCIGGISSQEVLDRIDELERQVGNESDDNIRLTRINNSLKVQVKELSEENLRLKNEMSNVVEPADLQEENATLKLDVSNLRESLKAMKMALAKINIPEPSIDKQQLSQVVMAIGQSIIEHNCKIPKTHYRALRKLAA